VTLRAWFNRRFSYENMDGDGLCPTYLERWTLLRIGKVRLYLHHFVGSDWALDPHDHPKTFLSIGLAGSYTEEVYRDLGTAAARCDTRRWRAPWIRRFPAEHTHRLTLAPGETCWTLCLVGAPRREWGFWYRLDTWMVWTDYVWGGPGDERKGCG
jgi:hypothetical protein